MPPLLKTFGVLAVAVAVLWKPTVLPCVQWLFGWPLDEAIGHIPKLSPDELTAFYENKTVLVVGGTRGTGFGTAWVLAKAGAHITVVGRKEHTGQNAVGKLKAVAKNPDQQFIQYQTGDLGSVRTALLLVEKLKQSDTRYDIMVVSAGVFPDWSSLHNEDGFEKSFAVEVVGRFILYRHMHHFLNPSARILNILASGNENSYALDRTMALGEKDPTNLLQAVFNMNTAHEIMLAGLDERQPTLSSFRAMVSTHPGVIATELHQGQGYWVDKMMAVPDWILGISEEECGLRQASILAHGQLHKGKLSYVDLFSIGRKRSPSLQKQVDEHLDWLWSMLVELDKQQKEEEEEDQQPPLEDDPSPIEDDQSPMDPPPMEEDQPFIEDDPAPVPDDSTPIQDEPPLEG